MSHDTAHDVTSTAVLVADVLRCPVVVVAMPLTASVAQTLRREGDQLLSVGNQGDVMGKWSYSGPLGQQPHSMREPSSEVRTYI